jgi:hypothetical protein
MNKQEVKSLLLRSLDKDCNPEEISRITEDAGISYEFSEGFTDKVFDRIYNSGKSIINRTDFIRSMNLVFYRITLTGIAAIILLLLSILIGQGTFTFDSFLGLGNGNDESIICLITGN